ncbi:MAG: hypothetical protein ABFS86_05655 [Planctomycetota bacterium]
MGEDAFRAAGIWIVVLAIMGGGLIMAMMPQPHDSPPSYRCMNNLKQLGGFFQVRQVDGRLEDLVGAAFFLQFRDEVRPEWMAVFRCPGGPEDVTCSYRGPDATSLGRLRDPGLRSVILACCANGENGDEPFHDDGVCVLWSSGKVEFIPWEEMEGCDGGPVKVGPGSPDPRFRHLVR